MQAAIELLLGINAVADSVVPRWFGHCQTGTQTHEMHRARRQADTQLNRQGSEKCGDEKASRRANRELR